MNAYLRCYPPGYGEAVAQLHLQHIQVIDSDDEGSPINMQKAIGALPEGWGEHMWDDADLGEVWKILKAAGEAA